MDLDKEVAILRKEMDEVRTIVRDLDTRTISLEKALAVITENLTYIKIGQDRLNANVSKALWAFFTVVIISAANWVLQGGLAR